MSTDLTLAAIWGSKSFLNCSFSARSAATSACSDFVTSTSCICFTKEGGLTGDALLKASLSLLISSFAFFSALASVASDAEGTTSRFA